jgi:cysteine-rich repeat protein
MKTLGIYAATALLFLLPAQAHAYCAHVGMWDLFWMKRFPTLNVPVWVADGSEFGVQHTGRTPEEIAAIVQEVIARHNEANVGPRLYFAGTTAQELDLTQADPSAKVPFGIYVHSVGCDILDANPDNGSFCKVTEAGSLVACGGITSIASKARIFLRPAVCPSVSNAPFGMAKLEGLEAPAVILHELGHTLGLGHTDEPCVGTKGNGSDDTAGVMGRLLDVDERVATREWRKDDLDGLAFQYPNQDYQDQVIVYWDDSGFPQPPTDAALHRLELADPILRPMSVSGNFAGDIQLGVSVSLDNQVMFYVWDEYVGGIVEQDVVEPSPMGLTYSSPAAAMGGEGGNETMFVVWHAGEGDVDYTGRLRWALRAVDGGPWSYGLAAKQVGAKRFGAGYDPATERYLIATLTDVASFVQLIEVNQQGEQVAMQIFGGVEAFDVGNVICAPNVNQRDCMIPYSRSEMGGPYLGWIEVDSKGVTSIVDVDAAPSLQLDGAQRDPAAESYAGVTGALRYTVADDRAGGLSDQPALSLPYSGEGWPFEAAEYSVGGEQRTRVFARRFAACGNGTLEPGELCDDGNPSSSDGCVSPFCKLAACGDGVLRSGVEECDDGNVDPSDGCDETCLLEAEDAGTSGDAGALGDEEDCNCRAPRGRPAAIGLPWVALLWWGRRRLTCARAQEFRAATNPSATPRA